MLKRASVTGRRAFTAFLDPVSAAELAALAKADGMDTALYGGCDDAERVIAAIHLPGDPPEDWPLAVLDILWSKHDAAPGHRDVLGALLALGIERDQVGDIRIDADRKRAWVCVGRSIGEYMLSSLTEVGRAPVRVQYAKESPPAAERGETQTINVAAPRLDAILAATMHLSRAKAQEVIRAGRVQVNWTLCERIDATLRAGDTLSIRGRGRAKVLEVEGVSRKGRLFISIESFLEKRG